MGLVVLLLLCLVPGSVAGASPVAAAGSANQWAYGASTHASGSGTPQRGGSFAMNAYFGWHVVLSQKNTSSSTFVVEAQRTMGLWVFVRYCYPSCTQPSYSGNVTAHAWESTTTFANFTSAGSVTVNGSSVPALALQNVASSMASSYTETALATIHGSLGQHTSVRYLALTASATLVAQFVPALGLVPLSPTRGESWSSMANYTASGVYRIAVSNATTPILGVPMTHDWTRNGSADSNGTITLQGGDEGSIRLANGASVTAILLQSAGPFDAREGFILLPQGADLFGGGPHGPSAGTASSAQVATSRVDFLPGAGDHLELLASATSFTPSAATPAATTSTGGLTAMLSPSPSSTAADSPGPSLLQAQPESVPVAQQGSRCLVSGCAATGSPIAGGSVLLPLLLVTGAAVVVAALVVQRRRQIPSPPRPLAALYPTVTAPAAAPTPTKPKSLPTEAPPGSSGPLDQLW